MPTLSETVRQIVSEINASLYERTEAVNAITVAALARQHSILYGPPGMAKSLLARALCERITGANFKDLLLDRQLPPESLFGPWDIAGLKSGQWHRLVDGYLPTSHVWFLDEIGKAGPAVLNPLLTALNERMYHNNSKPMPIPLLFCVAASNEQLEPELAAVRDRFLIHLDIGSIAEDSNFASFLSDPFTPDPSPTTISLDDFKAATKEVEAVTIPDSVVQRIVRLRHELVEGASADPSPRRWRASMGLVRAQAWLNGRSSVDEDDLAILRHALWEVPEQKDEVFEIVMAATGEYTRTLTEYSKIISDIEHRIDVPSGTADQKKASVGGDVIHKLRETQTNLTKLRESAAREGRDISRVDDLSSRCVAANTRALVELLGMSPQAAGLASGR